MIYETLMNQESEVWVLELWSLSTRSVNIVMNSDKTTACFRPPNVRTFIELNKSYSNPQYLGCAWFE